MPFASTLTSVNFEKKTVYSGKCRFPFTKNRHDINHLGKRAKAALIVYALNDDSYLKEIPIFNINHANKTDFKTLTPGEENLIKLQEKVADCLGHIENKKHADLIYDTILEKVDALSLHKNDIGKFRGPFKAKIELTDQTPIFQPLRPQPYGYRDLLIEHENNMIEIGVVQEGLSNF